MKKRILASFLSLVLVLSLVPASALAADAEHESGSGTQTDPWDVSINQEKSVTAYLTGNDETEDSEDYILHIEGNGAIAPEKRHDEYGGKKSKITKIEIGSGITSIGTGAFWNCTAASELVFGSDSELKEIGKNAFHSNTSLKEITLPASLETIGNAAFYGCKTLESVSFEAPNNLSAIDANAFAACVNLKYFNNPTKSDGYEWMPDHLAVLGEAAFNGDVALVGNVTIPADVENLGNRVFCKASSLSSISFENGSKLKSIGNNVFENLDKIEHLVLPDSLESIGENAFRGMTNLKTITIPASVSSIGAALFCDCNSLESIKFESGSQLKSLPRLYGNYKSITLSDGLQTIQKEALSYSKIESLQIPSTVECIGANAFKGSSQLHSLDITALKDTATIDASAFAELGTIPTADPRIINVIYLTSSEFISHINTAESFRSDVAVTNGGTFAEDTDFKAGTLATPTKEGNIFAGWYSSTDFSGEAVTTPTAGQTYYAKWIELKHEGITLEYGSTSSSFPTIDGVALTGWFSANPDVVKIENGQMIATGVGKTTITADASLTRSGEKLTVNVEVTPMPITFGTGDHENPHGTITYPYTGMAPDFAQFAKFYQAVKGQDGKYTAGEKAITLTEGTDIVFEYDAGGGKNDYHYLPIDVTDSEGISVTIKLVNPNYRFVTESAPTQSDSIKETVIVQAEGKTEVPIMGVPAAGETMTYPYNGQPQPPVSNLTRMSAGSIKNFTIHFYPWGDTEFTEAHLKSKTVDELTPEAIRKIAPTEPGSYLMIVDGVSDTEYAYRSWIFTITKATVTIKADDKSVYVGDAMPELTYTVTGLVGEDALTMAPTLTCEANNTDTAGTYTIEASGAAANAAHYELVYEDGTLTVSRRSSGGGGGGSSGDYIVSVDPDKHGTVTVSPKRADKGDTVTITVKPDKGYELDELTVTDKGGDTIKIKDKGNGKFTFTMPGSKVTVEASFKQIGTEPEVPTFVDVPADAYYADAVAWAVKKGITSGTSATTFTPDASCTRAQMVTFLWRANGSPKADGANPFTDVSADAYYYDAVLWAVKQGITSGTSATTFSPDAVLTRGQTVTFLWRANGSPAVSGSSFGDVDADAYYADAVAWAVSEGITAGTGDNNFSPDAPCTRAQIVTFMYRDAK